MAVLKLSQIATGSAPALTDTVIGVVGGTTDQQYTVAQLQYTIGLTFYVSAAGNDSNDGLSAATSWKTIAKVNASTFKEGSCILFKGGETFSGAIVSPNGGTSGNPITFGSYGGGKAIINSGASIGFSSINQPGVITRDLSFVGSSSNNSGIKFNNSLASNAHLQNVQVINCDVSGYGLEGICLEGSNGKAGYDDFFIFGNTVNNCCSISNSGKGTAGIRVVSQTGYGSGTTTPSHADGVVAGNKVTNCLGTTDTNWTGSGIVVSETRNCEVYGNIADGNGGGCLSANGGPVAIWTYDSINVDIYGNRATNNSSGNNKDGGGFGLDGGSLDCSLRNNYSRNNKGAGYMIYSYNDGTVTTNDRSTVVYNVSDADGAGGTGADAPTGLLLAAGTGGIVTNARVFGNTVHQSVANSHAIMIGGDPTAAAAITAIIDNNHIIQTGGADLVNVISNAVGAVLQGNKYNSTIGSTFVWNGTTYTELAPFSATTGNESASTYATVMRAGEVFVNSASTNGTGFSLINTSSGGKSISFFNSGSANGYGVGTFGLYNNTDDRAIFAYYTSTKQFVLESNAAFGWSPNQYALTPDTLLYRGAAGLFGINGNTSSFPGLKNNGSELQARLADDSSYAKFRSAAQIITADTLTGSSTTPAFQITQTWNTTGAIQNGLIYANITDTASDGDSWLFNFYVNGVQKFRVRKDGLALADTFSTQGNEMGMTTSIGPSGYGLNSSSFVYWASGGQWYSSPDLGLGRNAVGILEVNDSTAGAYRDIKARYAITNPTTVASLASAGTKGRRSFVTDANATTFATIVAGGGSNNVPVYDDGTNWRIG